MSKSKSPTEWLDSAIDELYTLKSGGREKFKQAILNHVEAEKLQTKIDVISDMIVECYNHDNPIDIAEELQKERRLLDEQRTQAKQLIRGKD